MRNTQRHNTRYLDRNQVARNLVNELPEQLRQATPEQLTASVFLLLGSRIGISLFYLVYIAHTSVHV
ncbi:hypothetical protein LY76DRAFT_592510, partial [Colletotrichum caudatum]